MKPFVDVAWLQAHRDEVVLADVRWYLDGRSGIEAFRRGRIPGARFVDLDTVLAGPPSPAAGRHPLPDPDVFAAGMRRLGIGDDSVVVAYDDAGGVTAARLVWMLRVTGHAAALLDGGLAAWPGELDASEEAGVEAARFTARPWPADRLAELDELDGAIAAGAVLIDAREAERYRGETEPIDPRAGHVPGALSVPCRENVAEGHLREEAELRARFAAAGIGAGREVISMCGSGVTACHNLLVLEQLGLGPGRLYPGSWSQYSADARRPAAAGPAPR